MELNDNDVQAQPNSQLQNYAQLSDDQVVPASHTGTFHTDHTQIQIGNAQRHSYNAQEPSEMV